MNDSNQRLLALNTASNYVLMAIRILQGILVTRWLYHYLGSEYYGFWSILWTFFLWMIIFNLGFGASTQKYTAEQLFKTDARKYNTVISLIFGSYLSIAFLIAAAVVVGSFFIPELTGLEDAEKIAVCKKALLIFGFGTAALFPLAMFSDILAGLRLIYVKNVVLMFVRVGEALGVLLVMALDGGFLGIVTFSITLNILFNLFMGFLVKRRIPQFRLRPVFDGAVFREIFNFSAFAYINSLGNLVMAKTDRFVLGAILGLPAVSTYQIGTRLSEISQTMSSQFMDNVVPFSAHLIHEGKIDELKRVLLSGMRFSAFVCVGASALFFILTPQTIRCLFGVDNPDAFLVSRWFLVSAFVAVAVRGVPSKYLLMAGRHRFIATATIAQAVLTVALSVYLCRAVGFVGIIWGVLIPNLLVSIFAVLPAAMRGLKFGAAELLLIFIKPALVAVPMAGLCLWLLRLFGERAEAFLPLTCVYLAGGLFYLATSWFFVLTKTERVALLSKIPFLKIRS